ncbi:MAG: SDR family oxidoreductase [Myxococcota bacterium]
MSTVVITGANRGIGLELARQLHARNDDVIAVCRSSNENLDKVGVRVEAGVDVGDEASVQNLATRLKDVSIDILINNAGVLAVDALPSLDFAEVNRQFEINAIGPLRVTKALIDRLDRGSKVAIITSRMGSIADNTSGGMYGYRMSKAAVNAAGKSLANDLQPRGIAVQLLHPGFVQTDMTGGNGNITPDVSAADLIKRIDELDLAATGTFRHANGESLSW